MNKIKKLHLSELNPKKEFSLNFKSTKDLMPFSGIIGQEQALKSITSALEIKAKGFNLYVSGNLGIGKTKYVMSIINKLAAVEKVPSDFCYIYNFDDPSTPLYIELEAGRAYELKTDMNQFITLLTEKLTLNLTGDTYEKHKNDIVSRYSKIKQAKIASFDKETYKQGFKLHYGKDGIKFSPVINGVVMNEEQFLKLPDKDKKYFKEKSPAIHEKTLVILKELGSIDMEIQKTVKEWETNLTTFITSECIKALKQKYKDNSKLQDFFYLIQEDVVNNLEFFKQYDAYLKSSKYMPNNKNMPRPAFPFDNYKVNIIIDNNNLETVPAVLAKFPNYFDIFGNLEYEITQTGPKATYMSLKPGLIHKANGGYLILNMKDLLTSLPMWEALKRVIRSGQITIDPSRDIPNMAASKMSSMRPEAIPVKINFILIGNEANYMQLAKLDPDFKKLFKIKSEFENTYEKTEENMELLARFIAYVVEKNHLLHFDKSAVLKIIEYSTKMASDINKLISNMTEITDICIEANHIATSENSKIVKDEDVTKAFLHKKERYSLYDTQLNKMITSGNIIISTEGEQVGQINGLTILNNGDFMFGKPVRITANTFLGNTGILNIEREIQMSGSSHSKGVLILSAFIGEKFAQNFPLSFNASICFEQLYNGVDGDSASSTELYAILSSLADVPIKQNFAVTGSVNQKGEIQPIGGVSEKIEGFFNVCKQRGLKDNAVLIPFQNVNNLNLNDEIKEAVEKGEFSIYPITHIDEGIELLTGLKAGKQLEDGQYEAGTIYFKVYRKLQKYANAAKSFN